MSPISGAGVAPLGEISGLLLCVSCDASFLPPAVSLHPLSSSKDWKGVAQTPQDYVWTSSSRPSPHDRSHGMPSPDLTSDALLLQRMETMQSRTGSLLVAMAQNDRPS